MPIGLFMVLSVATVGQGPAAPAAPYEHLLARARAVACQQAVAQTAESGARRLASVRVLPLENDPGQLLNAAARAGLTMIVTDDLNNPAGQSASTPRVRAPRVGTPHRPRHSPPSPPLADAGGLPAGDPVGYGSSSEGGPIRQSVPDALWAIGRGLLVLVAVLLTVTAAAAISRARGRARRERLARRLIAVCTAPATPVPGLLDRARAALRRAQMTLAERGCIDQAARILDERVRLERLRQLAHHGGGFDAALLFGAPAAPLDPAQPPVEILAMDVARHALRIEATADREPANLQQSLSPLRQACRRLASALDHEGL